MKRLRFCGILICLCLLLSVTACTRMPYSIENGAAETEYPIEVRGVTIEKVVSSVAVYSDSLADVIMSLTSAEQLKLTARGSDSVHPDIEVLPTAGTGAEPDVEQLKTLGVQLILTETPFSESIQTQLDEASISVLVLEKATDRASLIELYRAVGSALSGGRTGYTLGETRANQLLMALDDVQRVIPESESVLVAGYVLDENGRFATDQTMTGQLFSYVGAVNLAADADTLTAAELRLANPSVLFCASGLKDMLQSDVRFAELDAVKNGRVAEIPIREMSWQGLSIVKGAIHLATVLYPELNFETDSTSSEATSEPVSSEEGTHPVSVNAQSSRADILTLQDRLIELGYMQPPGDGVYGYWTKACIAEFQRRAGLEQTGIADERTMQALYADDAPRG